MKAPTLLLALALAVSACSAPETPQPEAPMETVGERPDAANPAGHPEGMVPPGWKVRFDHNDDFTIGTQPDSVDTYFVTMTPGWHVTTKPAGIFYHPASTASGAYTASTKIHLFPPGARREAYGLFLGGSSLDGADQAYVYFLIRRTGEFLVKRRAGADTEELIPWTASPAVTPYPEGGSGTVENTLSVRVADATVHFLVNGTEVATLPREGLQTDGIVGLRLNHALNVHVEDLSVTPAA